VAQGCAEDSGRLCVARDGLRGLHISELDAVNVGLTMAHCYSDLSRLSAGRAGRGGGGLEPPARGRGRMARQDGVIFLMEGVPGDLRRAVLFL